MRVQVDVHRFDPGSQSLRLAIGFGAGAGSLVYTAACEKPDGSVRAELQGEERFIGIEPRYAHDYGAAALLGGAEQVRSVLLQEAARHIVESCRGGSPPPE